jgi:DNA-binding transcriptional ArsR family regulator
VSFSATAWGWGQPVGDATARLVLLCLCDAANDRHEAWPALATVAERCDLSVSTVQRAITRLEALGLVEISGNGRRRRYAIPVTVTAEQVMVTNSNPVTVTIQDDQPGHNPVTVHSEPVTVTNYPVKNQDPYPPTPHGLEREPNPEKQGGSNPQGEGRGDTFPAAWLIRSDGVSGTTVADVIRAHGKWSLEEMELRGQTPKNADRYRASVEASFAQEHATSVAARLTRYLPDVPATLVLAAEMGRPCPALAAYLPPRPQLPESPKLPPEVAAERFAALKNQVGLRLVTEAETA